MDGLALSNLIQGAGIGYSAARSESERLAKSRRDQETADLALEKERINVAGLKDVDAKKKAIEQDTKDFYELNKKQQADSASATPSVTPTAPEFSVGSAEAKPSQTSPAGATDMGLASVQNAAQPKQAQAFATPDAPTAAAPAVDQYDPASFNLFMRDRAAARGDQAAAALHHDAYRAAVQKRIALKADAALRDMKIPGLGSGINTFVKMYNDQHINDGKTIVKNEVATDPATKEVIHTFTLNTGEVVRAKNEVLKDYLAQISQEGSAANQQIARLDANLKTDEKIDEKTRTGETAKTQAEARLLNARANLLAEGKPLNGKGGLTRPQQVKNLEIDKARELTAGLSSEEIKKRTAKFTNTGRENPAYDSALESRLRIAGHRKYGEDDYFDNLRPDAAPSDATPEQRFSADPAMKNYRLGNQTPDGKREVLDASGKLIGHFE